MRKHVWLSALLVFAAGCGGSGSSPSPNAQLSLFWNERSRTIPAPSSALSAKIHVARSGPGPTTAIDATVDRPAGTAAQLQTADLGHSLVPGRATVVVEFHAGVGGAGDIVGRATGDMTVGEDGRIDGTVATYGDVTNVVVAPNQEVEVGKTEAVDASVYDSAGRLVAVTPGSVFTTVVEGQNRAQADGPNLKATARGEARITVTVDSKVSPSATIRLVPEAKAYIVESLNGPTGASFVNGMSGDGLVAVGASSSPSGQLKAIRWTREGGTVEIPGLTTLGGGNGAECTNLDGSIIGGSHANPNASQFVPWRWTAATGTQALPLPADIVSAQVVGMTDDGTAMVGQGNRADGSQIGVVWAPGGVRHAFNGVVRGIAPDGSYICGSFPYLEDGANEMQGILYINDGHFRRLVSSSPTQYLSSAEAVSNAGTVAVGVMAGLKEFPGIWTPAGGPVLVNGTVTTKGTAVSADGRLIGISGGSAWLANLYSPTTGLYSLDLMFQLVQAAGGPDLAKPFNDAHVGPESVVKISNDRMTAAGIAVPAAQGQPHGYVVDFADFADL